ncbi:hypothetical protein [Aquimarina hainanensis]|uniref:hypothetical protein n=1 Tax=Aquimarina hainanensis TaxID=1578017 RepID=UPI0036199865
MSRLYFINKPLSAKNEPYTPNKRYCAYSRKHQDQDQDHQSNSEHLIIDHTQDPSLFWLFYPIHWVILQSRQYGRLCFVIKNTAGEEYSI